MKIHPLIYFLVGISLLITLPESHSKKTTIIDIQPAKSTVPSTKSVELPESLQAKVALAKHLKQQGANLYSVYWCGYCNRQLNMFGEVAANNLNRVECDSNGKNPLPELCLQKNITGYPTWEIDGQFYPGLQSLDKLADLSNYQGSRNWE